MPLMIAYRATKLEVKRMKMGKINDISFVFVGDFSVLTPRYGDVNLIITVFWILLAFFRCWRRRREKI
jgi:hypothetical protein